MSKMKKLFSTLFCMGMICFGVLFANSAMAKCENTFTEINEETYKSGSSEGQYRFKFWSRVGTNISSSNDREAEITFITNDGSEFSKVFVNSFTTQGTTYYFETNAYPEKIEIRALGGGSRTYHWDLYYTNGADSECGLAHENCYWFATPHRTYDIDPSVFKNVLKLWEVDGSNLNSYNGSYLFRLDAQLDQRTQENTDDYTDKTPTVQVQFYENNENALGDEIGTIDINIGRVAGDLNLSQKYFRSFKLPGFIAIRCADDADSPTTYGKDDYYKLELYYVNSNMTGEEEKEISAEGKVLKYDEGDATRDETNTVPSTVTYPQLSIISEEDVATYKDNYCLKVEASYTGNDIAFANDM